MKKRPFKKAHCGEMPFGRHYSPLEEKAAKLLILPLPQKVDSRENFNGEMQKILIF